MFGGILGGPHSSQLSLDELFGGDVAAGAWLSAILGALSRTVIGP